MGDCERGLFDGQHFGAAIKADKNTLGSVLMSCRVDHIGIEKPIVRIADENAFLRIGNLGKMKVGSLI